METPLIRSVYLCWLQYILQSFPELERLIFGHAFTFGFKYSELVLFENSEQTILQGNARIYSLLKSPSSSKYPVKFPSSEKYSFWNAVLKVEICSEHRLKTSSKTSRDFLRLIGTSSGFWNERDRMEMYQSDVTEVQSVLQDFSQKSSYAFKFVARHQIKRQWPSRTNCL